MDVVTREYRFDIERLGERVVAAIDFSANDDRTRDLPIACYGASTGAAAALIAAAERPAAVRTVISRGGRPDLAGEALPRVKAPTLMIVGSRDEPVIALNREAMAAMSAPVELLIIPGATHLFEEPGTLEQVTGRDDRLVLDASGRDAAAGPALTFPKCARETHNLEGETPLHTDCPVCVPRSPIAGWRRGWS